MNHHRDTGSTRNCLSLRSLRLCVLCEKLFNSFLPLCPDNLTLGSMLPQSSQTAHPALQQAKSKQPQGNHQKHKDDKQGDFYLQR